MQTAIALLVSQGHVARVGSTLQLRDRAAMHRRPPASRVNIRSISSETYRLLLEEGDGGGGGKVLETVEADKAFYQVSGCEATYAGGRFEGRDELALVSYIQFR